MRIKKLTALMLAGTLMVSALTGCGINKNATVAKLGDEEISLGLVNFICRHQQATVDDNYTAYFKDDVWSQDLYGQGVTMQEDLKASVVEGVHELYTLKANADEYGVELTKDEKKKITQVAEAFLADNSKEALDEMGATQEIVEEMLTLYTIKSKMHEAIIKDVDTNVSDEEANMRAYTMVEISTSSYTDENGQTVEYTEEQIKEIKDKTKKLAEDVKGGKELKKTAESYGFSATTGTYDADNEELDETVKAQMDKLKEGETSGVISTDTADYLVKIDKDTDKEATEENKKSIIEHRQDDKYNEVLEGWQEDDGWKVYEKQLAKIEFKNHFTQQDGKDDTEKESVTDNVTETTENTVQNTESNK